MKRTFTVFFVVANVFYGCGKAPQSSGSLDIDFGREFTDIQDQLSSGFCQSYAFTALLEHRWHQKTGVSLKLSEKSIIRATLRTVIETYWNAKEQNFDTVPFSFHLGNFGMSSLLKAIETYGVVPESSYPTLKTNESGDKSFTFDIKAYEELTKYSSEELNSAGVTKDAFLKSVDDLFGIPPDFSVSAKLFSYDTFHSETRVFETAKSLGDFLEVNANNYEIVYNSEGFVSGQTVFNSENHKKFADSDARFTKTPRELSAQSLLGLADKILDQGVPLVMWNKWQELKNGTAEDSGGHLTVIVGYETFPDKTRWYRIKNSYGARTSDFIYPGTTYPIRTIDGYTYWEKSVLEKALMGLFIPSVFLANLE